mmetsp:Transcript_42497/g.102367  ORF Transcript_42497/g.102367 Transcript_42497/m.102367 type:complete len:1166 (-) Transcript_42497:90-3587(-)
MWSKKFNLLTPQKPTKQSSSNNLPPLPATAPPKSFVSSYPLDDENSEVSSRVSSSSLKSAKSSPTNVGPSSASVNSSVRKSGNIIKKLWCKTTNPKSALKKSQGSTTSVEDLGIDSGDSHSQASSNLYGVVISAPSSSTKDGTSLVESREPSVRDLDEDDKEFVEEQKENRMGQSSCPNSDKELSTTIQTMSPRNKHIDDDLRATASSPESQQDLFLPHGSTSSDEDGFNPGTETMDGVSTPQKLHSVSSHPMKTPGMGIPTPSTKTVDGPRSGSTGSGLHLPFPHRLDRVIESPLIGKADTDGNNKVEPTDVSMNQSNVVEEGNDDDAFLPDDFGQADDAFLPDDFQQSQQQSYTWEDVQKLVADAERKVQAQLVLQHQTEMQEFQEEAEKLLVEHGSNWKEEAEAEYSRLREQLKEEKNKIAKKTRELEDRDQALQSVQNELKTSQETRENLESRVKELEDTNDTHVLSLTSSNESLEGRIAEMETEMEKLMASKMAAAKEKEDLAKVLREKATVEEQLADTTKRLNEQTDTNKEVSKKLQEAHEDITSLKERNEEEMRAVSESSTLELEAAKAEIETLRALRSKEEQDRLTMESKLQHAEEVYRSDITPRKSTPSVPPSPASGAGQDDIIVKMERQLEGMGKVLKRYKTERDDLRERLKETERHHVHAIEIAVKQATTEMTGKLEHLQAEIERIRDESTKKSTEEINQLIKEVELLKSQHQEELSSLRQKTSEALEKVREEKKKDLKNLQAQFDQKENDLQEVHSQAVDDLKKQLDDLKKKHAQELQDLKNEHEKKSSELLQTSEKQQELEQQIKTMIEMHQAEIEVARTESGQEIEHFKQTIQKLESDLKLKNELYENMDGLEQKLENVLSERDELLKTISRHESQLKEVQDRNSVSLREVRAEHGKEIDDLLAQLDMVEAEQNEKAKKLQELVKEKELCLSALSSNLADSESRFSTARSHSERLENDVEQLRRELEHTKSELISCKLEHDRAMEEQVVLRDQTCEEAQRKIIEKVEKQFDERNAMYKELKRTLDESNSKVSILERDLRFAKKESDELKKRFEAREADLKDELAQAKAAVAKSNANLAHAENNHRSEIDRLRDSEEKMRIKKEDAESTSRSVQRTLASIVTEKDKLLLENKEMNAICEELMAELEGAKSQK